MKEIFHRKTYVERGERAPKCTIQHTHTHHIVVVSRRRRRQWYQTHKKITQNNCFYDMTSSASTKIIKKSTHHTFLHTDKPPKQYNYNNNAN